MSKLRSLFKIEQGQLQVFIDKAKDMYAPLFYPTYFDVAPPQLGLTYSSAIGRSRIEAAATVVDRDGKTPLRSRQGLEKLSGSIPAIREMFALKESDYRDFLNLQNMPGVDDATKLQQMLQLVWNDVKNCGDACHKRIDVMVLQALSTGKINITVENNPDGIVHDEIDLLMSASNKKTATTTWANATDATPLKDIEAVVIDAKRRGITFAKILMSWDLWMKFRATKDVKDTMLTVTFGPKAAAGTNPSSYNTLEKINDYLTGQKMPIIELVDQSIGIEKDGIIAPTNFFNENNATFVPAGKLGTIKNALAMEKMKPVEHVTYADYNKVLISKWSANEPWGEFTKGEWNAFPAFEAIDATYILTAVF